MFKKIYGYVFKKSLKFPSMYTYKYDINKYNKNIVHYHCPSTVFPHIICLVLKVFIMYIQQLFFLLYLG